MVDHKKEFAKVHDTVFALQVKCTKLKRSTSLPSLNLHIPKVAGYVESNKTLRKLSLTATPLTEGDEMERLLPGYGSRGSMYVVRWVWWSINTT